MLDGLLQILDFEVAGGAVPSCCVFGRKQQGGRCRVRRQPRYGVLIATISLLGSGCQSAPPIEAPVSSDSSILAVDVTFPLAFSRDPVLIGVGFLKEPVDSRLEGDGELLSASWIKGSRAYLLDPEPGSYLVVVVTSAVSLPRRSTSVPLGGRVTGTVSTAGAVGQTVVLPRSMALLTRRTIGPKRVEFAGAVQIRYRSSDRVNANTQFEDSLQRRMAELVHPGVTSRSGLAGQLTRTWKANATESSIANGASDRDKFLADALADFGDSPWAQVIRLLD